MSIKEQLDLSKLPQHIAIIMDGNGRWAKREGKLRMFGHQQGVLSVRKVVEAAGEIGIPYLTMYTFSTENWNRPKYEVIALMELFVNTISKEVTSLKKNNVRLNAIGNLNALPDKCREELKKSISDTSSNTGLTLTLALSYSARWEIVEACRDIAHKVSNHQISLDDINETIFSQNLSTGALPDPDLLIRTSGEYRISNYLLWQMAYTELYFTEKLWPDFGKEDFFESILNYQNRERRFGRTSEQL